MKKKNGILDFIMNNGFMIVFVIVLLVFSLSTANFLSYENILTVVATASPWIVIATGLCYVIMAGSIDISIGSTLFFAIATTNMAMVVEQTLAEQSPLGFLAGLNIPVGFGIPIILVLGGILGSITGFLIVVAKINPLLASMGMMFITRGLTLWSVAARVQSLPTAMQEFGQNPYFREFIICVSLLIVITMHIVLQRTKFGRQVLAIGNSPEIALRLGVPVKRVQFATYVIAGAIASAGGFLQVFQIGSIQQRLGFGYEFIAIAAIVVGGISLFGGEGKMFPGLVIGGLTLVIVENGLTHMGVTPYAYPFVRGGIIFVAMLADALKTRVLNRVHVIEETDLEPVKEQI